MKVRSTVRTVAWLCAAELLAGFGVLAEPLPPSDATQGTLVSRETKITTITGTYIPRKIRRVGRITDTGLNVIVIDRAQIDFSGATTVDGVLSAVSGVRVRTGP